MTHQSVQRSTLANLQVNLSTMADLQAKMSSGKKINVPSDDPAGASDMLRLRGEQRAQAQYQRNADDGVAWLTTIDTSLQTTSTTLRRVRDLVLQSGSGAASVPAREAIAVEIEGLRDELLQQANTTYLGRNVFAGTSNAGVAFTVDNTTDPATYTFTGAANATVERQVADATTVRVDADGAKVYGDGAQSVFALLDTIAATLRTPDGDATAQLGAIDARFETVLTELAGVGARQTRVVNAQTSLVDAALTTKTQLSAIEDIDLAEIILELGMQEVAYQGALGAAAKVLQPSLMDYLR
ncbi:flagellar hook-associated protein FlgL [Cellulomonas cellasea]|uniref:flagellar hook-associated protein FlgL n=1 Tax=Cellulomonas cellasea TaxID=43670 RepID=UPI0025A3F1E9|nr:flagellar hook-associated protein FlgL [Cellulomonas cellasea]MDM8083403.1 flagellar hook-associated protein FlgL [Cellulomonas cellasea]